MRLIINESVVDTIGLDVRQFYRNPTKNGSSFFRTLVEKETQVKNSGDIFPPRVIPAFIFY